MPLSSERDTPSQGTDIRTAPVAANTRIFQGALVAVNAAGFAIPATAALNLVPIGRARATYDNTGGAAGAITAEVDRGVFRFRNLTADPVTGASLHRDCFIADDDAVAATNGGNTRSVAGRVRLIEPAGVWVEIA